MEKLEAHEKGLLHRAFSVFIFNPEGKVLLQKRAAGKYHSGGLWTNSCCGHPRPDEPTLSAATRRLREEMNIIADLREKGKFIYKATLDKGLVEHELDHVFTGISLQDPRPDPNEAEDWMWADLAELREKIQKEPELYTAWLLKALDCLE